MKALFLPIFIILLGGGFWLNRRMRRYYAENPPKPIKITPKLRALQVLAGLVATSPIVLMPVLLDDPALWVLVAEAVFLLVLVVAYIVNMAKIEAQAKQQRGGG